MLQALESPARPHTRPAKARRATHHVAKPHDSTHASLEARCALDLPTLHRDIPTAITNVDTRPENQIRNSLLHLALQGVDDPRFKMDNKKSMVKNLLHAAEVAIETALAPVSRLLGLDSALWTSRSEAEQAETACEGCNHDADPLPQLRDYTGDDIMIIEITPAKGFEKTGAGAAEQTCLGKRTQAIEAVCPGFMAMVYTVLELVNRHLYPVITPRTLFDDYINDGMRDGAKSITDVGIALAELLEYYGDFDEMLETHGFTQESVTHQDIIEIHQEQCASILPSDFVKAFGTAAMCHCYWSDHEEMPGNYEITLWSDLNTARANMDLRPANETATREAIHALQLMIDLVREINSGACFVSGANYIQCPSYSSAKVWPEGSGMFYDRVLDDSARSAMENSEVLDALGWIVARADTPQSTAQSLQDIHRGAAATAMALNFINYLGEVA